MSNNRLIINRVVCQVVPMQIGEQEERFESDLSFVGGDDGAEFGGAIRLCQGRNQVRLCRHLCRKVNLIIIVTTLSNITLLGYK